MKAAAMKVGVIGTWCRGRHCLERGLAALDGVELRAFSPDPAPDPLLLEGKGEDDFRQYAATIGAEHVGDWRALVSSPDIDVVSVMVEPNRAADFVEAIAPTGKGMILDKPIAATPQQADRIVRAVGRHGNVVLVGYFSRFLPAFRRVRDLVAAGSVGRLLGVQVDFCFGSGPLAGFTGNQGFRRGFGGGDFVNLGTHGIDLANFVTDSEPRRVTACLGTFFYPDYADAGMEDLGVANISYENGVLAQVLGGRITAALDRPILELRITGTQGALRASAGDECFVSVTDRLRPEAVHDTPHEEAYRCFLECWRTGRPFPISVRSAARAVKVAAAAVASHGRPVEL